MVRIGPILLAATGVATPAAAQSPLELARPARALARAADTDGSGDVSAEERQAFLDSFATEPGATLDRTTVMARLLPQYLDANGDGVFTGADALSRLVSLDADESWTLDAAEVQVAVGSNDDWRSGRHADGIVAFGADANGDGGVDDDEWTRAVDAGESAVPLEVLAEWVVSAERRGDGAENAFGPSTLLLSLRSGLDGTQDGSFEPGDLHKLLADLDANGDGAIAPDELSWRRRGRWASAEDTGTATAGREPLMPWQRTLDDALALSRATGKPLLVCVNMDGESASDSLANYRYRDPEFVKLVEGFVPVLASPNTHNARAYDDRGRRIPDERFGRVLDAEHIAIEPIVFERYFDGQRVAPRHVGVAPDGTILFDLFLLQDLSAIDRALQKHGVTDVSLPDVTARSAAGLLHSPDAAGRERLESLFVESDEPARLRLAEVALDETRATQHPALIRLALRDPSHQVRAAAVRSLARFPTLLDLELFPEAMRVASRDMLPALSRQLAAHAEHASDNDQMRARRLSRICAALARPSEVIDTELWRIAVTGGPPPGSGARDIEAIYRAIDQVGQRIRAAPDDARLRAMAAELGLRGAEVLIAGGAGNPGFVLMDARASAEKAVELDPDLALGQACLAVVTHQLGDYEIAADAAARALPGLLDQASSKLAADVLYALADSRVRLLYPKLGSEEGWPLEWVADLLAAYDVLLAHPHGTQRQALAAIDAQWTLEAFRVQPEFLRRALERWPTSSDVHDRFRARALRDEGAAGLVAAYEGFESRSGDKATVRWFAGLAGFIAAERHVQDGRDDEALSTYRDSIATFHEAMSLEPSFGASSLHYVSLAHCGIARILLDEGRLDDAMAALRSGAQAYVGAFDAEDGLGHSPKETARDIRQALRRADREEAAEELRTYLSQRGVEL